MNYKPTKTKSLTEVVPGEHNTSVPGLPRRTKQTSTWQPSVAMERLLAEALNPWDPPKSWGEAVSRAKVSRATVNVWLKNPKWREWWTRSYLAGDHIYAAEAIQQLVRIFRDPKVSASVKVRASREIFGSLSRGSAERRAGGSLTGFGGKLIAGCPGSGGARRRSRLGHRIVTRFSWWRQNRSFS